ncbi:MAG: transketolase [Magnetococcales bacterium]|nr:transketolase [Magnetococcales bacterium]
MDGRSRHLRRLVLRAMERGGRGHLGSAFSLIEILRVLYDDVLRVRPDQPEWPGRDRCILSKGHGCLALYALLADKGFFPMEALDTFCRFDSFLGGHPERGRVPGVEASTGALGHGLSIGVGLALGARLRRHAHRVVVILGDGESNEGSVWEGAMAAAKHRLDHLIVLVDDNKMQSYGPTRQVMDLEPLADKWRAFGFAVREVDGHDPAELRTALTTPIPPDQPMAIICHTIKGKGVPMVENNPDWHHKSKLTPDLLAALQQALADR